MSRLTCGGPFWNKDCSSSLVWSPYSIIISSSCGFIDSERQFLHGASPFVTVRCCSVLVTADSLTGWMLRWLPHSQSQPRGCSRTASTGHASPPLCDFSMCLALASLQHSGLRDSNMVSGFLQNSVKGDHGGKHGDQPQKPPKRCMPCPIGYK